MAMFWKSFNNSHTNVYHVGEIDMHVFYSNHTGVRLLWVRLEVGLRCRSGWLPLLQLDRSSTADEAAVVGWRLE